MWLVALGHVQLIPRERKIDAASILLTGSSKFHKLWEINKIYNTFLSLPKTVLLPAASSK